VHCVLHEAISESAEIQSSNVKQDDLLRYTKLYNVGVNSDLGCFHHVDVGSVIDVSEVHASGSSLCISVYTSM
jgi:hypothetical protein